VKSTEIDAPMFPFAAAECKPKLGPAVPAFSLASARAADLPEEIIAQTQHCDGSRWPEGGGEAGQGRSRDCMYKGFGPVTQVVVSTQMCCSTQADCGQQQRCMGPRYTVYVRCQRSDGRKLRIYE
jgi:hypothetical protein